MLKRLWWATIGYGMGIATSYWAQRKVRRTVERYTPANVAAQAQATSRVAADRVKEAVIDLRDSARQPGPGTAKERRR